MTVENEQKDLLAAARGGMSPTAGDRARVRRGVDAALASGAVVTLPTPAAAKVAGAWRWGSRLAMVGAVAVLSAGISYRAGFHAGRDAERAASVGARGPAAAATVPPPEAPPASEPRPALTMGGESPPAGKSPVREGVSPRAVSHRRATADAPDAGPNSASLAEEVRALRSIERALRDGNPGFALALLRELDRDIPHGQLVEERLATRTIARCASGDTPMDVNLAEDFSARYPNSVYGRRVVDACAATVSPSRR